MPDFKGTKGKWITFMNDVTKEYSIGGGNDERYFIAKIHTTGRSVETCRANTNLIAAAPELLQNSINLYEFCKILAKQIDYQKFSDVSELWNKYMLEHETIVKKATE